jgi:hypothetical protein
MINFDDSSGIFSAMGTNLSSATLINLGAHRAAKVKQI